MRRVLAGAIVVLAAAGLTVVLFHGNGTKPRNLSVASASAPTTRPHLRPAPTPTSTTVAPRPRPAAQPSPPAAKPATTVSSGPVTLAGCPVPPHAALPTPPPPWHPAVLVPDRALPPVVAPVPWRSDTAALSGKGMWIWEWSDTDGGSAVAMVHQAVQAGLRQLWVRVGDSKSGFYGAAELEALVPEAHAAGLDVIAWGFPYLYNPVGDAAWTAQALAWRGPHGEMIDGFSADIERPTEGVDLTAQRVGVYLQAVRRAAGGRLIVATVYPPLAAYWTGGPEAYPYTTMARYVDAFAPMIYWECTDPGADASTDVARLRTLRPVDIIGQAYNMASVGGRAVSPSRAEITEFLAAGQRAGAIGASLWSWQTATPAEWSALAAYGWVG